ncbi:UDP-N-acetylglucosamine transferase subunit [Podospora bellae-mahoneyi]|uniref:UDP-N-acetylglucosamine transferase subunit ALG14 n=1 Tax=Podospora bellae-mahoneyi TaxID=2093777 RepID=A0ABR0FP90_9PEZI|nr:UDP-N-acetylglucosamine transferase subunit [Podospora bellae-mahoneyi]
MDPHLSDRGESQAATHKPLDSLADQPDFLQNNRQREGRSPAEQNLEPPASDFFSSSPQSQFFLFTDNPDFRPQFFINTAIEAFVATRTALTTSFGSSRKSLTGVTCQTARNSFASAPPAEEQDEIKMLESIDEMGGEGGLLGVFLALLCAFVAAAAAVVKLSWPALATLVVAGCSGVAYRHQTLVSSRRRVRGGLFPALARGAVPVASSRGAGILGRVPAYFLFVLGSGGHTTEMFETIKNSFLPSPAQHRRYVITSGDGDSLRRLLRLESLLDRAVLGSLAGGDKARVGTRDMFTIPRARRVHQPFWTAPFTSLVTGLGAVKALSTVPRSRKGEGYKWPNVIVTNGPGTGFVVALVAYILKLLSVVPQDGCKVVYVESWARINSLSLTGKMFYWSGIAEVFGVQHRQLCDKYEGVIYVGEVGAAKRARMG